MKKFGYSFGLYKKKKTISFSMKYELLNQIEYFIKLS